jgi:large subunit ribosomal protein L24
MIENKCHIKKDDKVKVITGKDRGKVGKVVKVIRKDNRILIENVNIVKRHTKPSAKNKQGGIVAGEAPIHVSNVLLMCNKCVKPVRIMMRTLENGKKTRVCRKCSEVIDK